MSDEVWAFVVPYLTLIVESAAEWEYALRYVFNGLRYMVVHGASGG